MVKTESIQTLVNRLIREGADALLEQKEAISLVASRVMDEHDDLSTASKRVRMQMIRSMAYSSDVTAGGLWCRDDGLFTCDEIARWAQRRYRGLFDDLPTKSRSIDVVVMERASASLAVETEWEPWDPEELRALLRALRAEIKQRDADDAKRERDRKEELASRFGNGKSGNS